MKISKICLLFLLIASSFYLKAQVVKALDEKGIEELGRQFTVQIYLSNFSGDRYNFRGSGVIVQKSQNEYIVITNRHLAPEGASCTGEKIYRIRTYDQKEYDAQCNKMSQRNDIMSLKFSNSEGYAYKIPYVPTRSNYQEGDKVYIYGFYTQGQEEISSVKKYFSTGVIVSTKSTQLLERWNLDDLKKPPTNYRSSYMLAYTNTTYQGMSGGPILNQDGDLIGLHSACIMIPPDKSTFYSPESCSFNRNWKSYGLGFPIK